ncbi:MFS transporter [Nocardioides KLBMP 9356]|uniref:MFS transporter n=1 Tax=Nocardioides potassii TaxID=2911371 RepID=A0ABS9H9T7_9ACTN|nr:MFS transporter [Nocardioides potassii]MCF6377985.1 MFS transporter [Nocardioides potassii]
MIAVLRRRDFGLLWLAGLVSVAGDWVLMTALPYVVYDRTGSVLATAGMVAAQLAPSIVLSSFAGVFVDRWDRRRVLVVTNVLQGLAVTALLLVGDGSLWIVYAVAAAQSAFASFSQPAEAALLPTLVREEQLVAANALNVLNNRLGRLGGVPLGAVLLATFGLSLVVVVDAVSFLVAAALVAAMRHRDQPHLEEGDATRAFARFWSEWIAGLRIVREDQTIAVLFVVLGLMTFGGTMLDPLFAPWIRDILGQGVDAVAILTVTSSLAGVAGSLVVGSVGARLSSRALMGWGSVIAGGLLLAKFNVPSLWVAVALSAVGGITAVASSVGVETLAQERTPEHVRGRVFGSLQATVWLMSLLGAVVGGLVGELVGLLPALDLAAALVLLSGVVVLALVRDAGHSA